ncbi:MAG: SPASM domain-containing protein [Alphaproteobacteria bacterium]|nr:SPASM domain-containing protein [Alphaproteobacteria bacterium]
MKQMSSTAKIKIVTYGGRWGWFLRKHFSWLTSWAYLNLQYLLRSSLYKKYIKFFDEQQLKNKVCLPCLISIETINRCNSTCSFCPAGKGRDKRPFAKMDEKLFYKIIAELKEWGFDGYLNLYVNNEPLMDNRIEDWYKYAKQQLPNAKMLLYTNGTLLSIDRFKKIAPYIDKIIINNYAETLTLHKSIRELYDFIIANQEYWNNDITIQIRYIKEVLTNRAGSAPNKPHKSFNNQICIMPWTDFTIYPSGKVGLCCSDAQEKTNLGNVAEQNIRDIWGGVIYQDIRQKIILGRRHYAFCKGCDFVDAGIRNLFIKNRLAAEERNND